MMQRMRRNVVVFVAPVVAAALLVVSPLIIGLVDTGRVDWVRLANIGQAYGAASVLISAVALVGIVMSLLAQQRQVRVSQEMARRDQHMTLLKMAIEEPDLMECWGDLNRFPAANRRQYMYVNMVVSFWYSGWKLGDISDALARQLVAVELFSTDLGVSWWTIARQGGEGFGNFQTIIESGYQQAIRMRDHREPTVVAGDGGGQTPAQRYE